MYKPYEFKEQDAKDFARHVGILAYERGSELHFKQCPYCHGKGRQNEKSFAIDLKTGTFHCLRSSCGVSGNMITLSKDFDFSLGNEIDEYYRPQKKFRKFKKLEKPIEPKPKAVEYLSSRGISESVIKQYEITVQNNNENVLVFPFFDEKGVMQFIKYRKIDYDKEKDSCKEWCESNCKPILFGMKQCNDFERLVITEGQIDSLSVITAGINNVVSVPTGAKGFTWVPYCWNWINKFKEIVVFGDYENGKISLLDELSRRLKITIKHVRKEDYMNCKDANEILQKYGADQVMKCVTHAEIVPIKQVIELADVEDVDIFSLEKLKTGIKQLDKLLYGGFPFGGVVLVSGKSGEGKLLADDTPVFTKYGWKNHGDLIVGDEVIGRYGEFVKVTHVFEKYFANMKVTLSNHETFYCHENHEWVVTTHGGNSYTERILTTKEIFDMKESGYKAPIRIITRKPLIGLEEELPVKPYTFGAWLGDGRNGNPDVCCDNKDFAVIESIIREGYSVSWHTKHKDTGVEYYGFQGLRSDLQKIGMCHARKTAEKYIPEIYITAHIDDRLELLAGLLDTDGYLDIERGRYTYSTTDIKLRDSFIGLVNTFGWYVNYHTQKAKTSTSGIVGKKDVYNINFVPRGLIIPCRVKRKRLSKVKGYESRNVTIRAIEYCEHKQGNCVQVDGGIYCVGRSMTPTHNSTLASQILVNAMEQGYKCFAYSGELPNYLFKAWMNFQVAGSRHIFDFNNKWGDKNFGISNTNKQLISEWYRSKAFLYDNSFIDGDEKESLLNTVENSIMQYGVRVILLDNLMTAIDLEAVKGDDKYDKQSNFIKRLTKIALTYDVLILLVAHKRKNNFSKNENDEISGSGDIANLALITVAYEKSTDIDESQRLMIVSKNRLFGKVNTSGWTLDYDDKSKRIYGFGDDLNREYGWNNNIDDGDGFEAVEEETPFD